MTTLLKAIPVHPVLQELLARCDQTLLREEGPGAALADLLDRAGTPLPDSFGELIWQALMERSR